VFHESRRLRCSKIGLLGGCCCAAAKLGAILANGSAIPAAAARLGEEEPTPGPALATDAGGVGPRCQDPAPAAFIGVIGLPAPPG
jgi:hypothetical protein